MNLYEMRFTLFKMKTLKPMILVLILLASLKHGLCCKKNGGPWEGANIGKEDCTEPFKGRTLRFESMYYKSYWISYAYHSRREPFLQFATRNEIYDHKTGISWHVHDCENGWVCLQQLGLPEHWLIHIENGNGYPSFLQFLSKVERDRTDEHMLKIMCDSCQHPDRCQLVFKGGYKVYPTEKGYLRSCSSCGNADWFDWEMVLMTSMEHWETVQNSVCNKSPRDIGVHFTSSQTVGFSKKVTETHGLDVEMSASLSANPLTWAFGGKVTQRNEWSNEAVQLEEHTTSVTIRGANGTNGVMVKPNKKAVLKQLVGYYGKPGDFNTDFTMKSTAFQVHIEDC